MDTSIIVDASVSIICSLLDANDELLNGIIPDSDITRLKRADKITRRKLVFSMIEKNRINLNLLFSKLPEIIKKIELSNLMISSLGYPNIAPIFSK